MMDEDYFETKCIQEEIRELAEREEREDSRTRPRGFYSLLEPASEVSKSIACRGTPVKLVVDRLLGLASEVSR
jgi:hypothetical protein